MTETKYIFPKQPQSMAVLDFIAVLIILFLALITSLDKGTQPFVVCDG